MTYRIPLARALGLGTAHAGTGHWWMQRLSAVALIPLTLWLVVFLHRLETLDHAAMLAWLAAPWRAALLLAYLLTALWHAQLGLQVVIEDYVHPPGIRLASLVAVKLVLALLAMLAVTAQVYIVARGAGL